MKETNIFVGLLYLYTFMIRRRKNQELFRYVRLFFIFWIVSTILIIARHQSYSFRICWPNPMASSAPKHTAESSYSGNPEKSFHTSLRVFNKWKPWKGVNTKIEGWLSPFKKTSTSYRKTTFSERRTRSLAPPFCQANKLCVAEVLIRQSPRDCLTRLSMDLHGLVSIYLYIHTHTLMIHSVDLPLPC